jgi:hypothetical protein
MAARLASVHRERMVRQLGVESGHCPTTLVIPDLIRDPFSQRRMNGSRIKSGMTM